MKLRVRSLKVIGDAAPGDAATTKESFEVEWKAQATPAALSFPNAPAGKYAKIDILLRDDGGKDAMEIAGVVRRGGQDWTYEIEDSAPLSFSVPLPSSTTLRPGGSLAITLRININDVVKDLDFGAAREDDDKLKIDDETPELLAAVRAAIAASVRFDGE